MADEIRDLWCNQPRDAVGTTAADVRRRAEELEAKTRRGLRTAALVMACSAAGYVGLLWLFRGTAQRIGSSLTLAAYLWCAYRFWKRDPFRRSADAAAGETCAAYRGLLVRLRDYPFLRSLLVPFVPGPAVFLLGFWVPEFGPAIGVSLTAALIVSPFAAAIPLLRRRRRVLEREIDELDALMRGA